MRTVTIIRIWACLWILVAVAMGPFASRKSAQLNDYTAIQFDQLNWAKQDNTDHAFLSDVVREKIRGMYRHQARQWRGAAWAMSVLAAIMFLSSFTLQEPHNQTFKLAGKDAAGSI